MSLRLAFNRAPSRGKSGKYFFYYKCRESVQNNISAIKAHEQLDLIIKELSIPAKTIASVKQTTRKLTEGKPHDNKQLLAVNKNEYTEVDKQLKSVEEKWINNQIAYDTYSRWFTNFNKQKLSLRARLEKLETKEQDILKDMKRNLDHYLI